VVAQRLRQPRTAKMKRASASATRLRLLNAHILATALLISAFISGCVSNPEADANNPSPSDVSVNYTSEPTEPANEPREPSIEETAGVSANNNFVTPSDSTSNPNVNSANESTNNLGLHTVTRIVDGDTVYVDGFAERVRLIGIDTPERNECGFTEATARITDLILGQQVTLLSNPGNEVDTWGRPLAFIEVNGVDVGGQLIAEGLAIPRYNSTDGFAEHPREEYYFNLAADAPLTCANSIIPETTSPEPTYAPTIDANPDNKCSIKGNISRSGEKIFHMPGQQHYDATIIDEAAGERWFCTVEQALAAGWRAAKR